LAHQDTPPAPFVESTKHSGLIDQKRAREVIEKAIEATGGAETLRRLKAVEMKAKMTGAIEDSRKRTAQAVEVSLQPSKRQFRQKNSTGRVVVLNGDEGWVRRSDGTITTLTGMYLADAQVQMKMNEASFFLYPLIEDKGYTLNFLGERKVDGEPALAVDVTREGLPDQTMYFNKSTHLLVKVDHHGKNLSQFDDSKRDEIKIEVYFTDFQEVDNRKYPSRTNVYVNGKLSTTEDILAIKFAESLPDSVFARPE
jgi:hypothetical protein